MLIRLVPLLSLLLALPVMAYTPPKSLPEGWDGVVTLGAQATMGDTRTSTLSGSAVFTYRSERWENQFSSKLRRSFSTIVVEREDDEGNPVLGADGEPLRQAVKGRTTDRRFVGVQPRWYWSGKSYLFSILDYETNKPADIDRSSRQIVGIGHKFWKSKDDFLAGEIGIGNKRLKQVSGPESSGGIGYVGMKFVRKYTDRTRVSAELDSDFGGENRFTEVGLGFAYKVSAHLALKFTYSSRMNTDIINPGNPLDSDVDSEATVSLEIDIL